MISFGKYVRKLRLEKGNTIRELASCLEISPTLLDQIEKGTANATKDQAFRLAGHFEVGVKDMLTAYQKERILSEYKDDSTGKKSIPIKSNSCLINNFAVASERRKNMQHTLSQLNEKEIEIRYHRPSYPLSSYIDCMLYCKGHNLGYSFEKVMPHGSGQLIIELDDHERVFMTDGFENRQITLKKAWVSGIQSQQHTYGLGQSKITLYIRFSPGGFYALTHLPQNEIVNTAVEADLFFGPSILTLREQLFSFNDVSKIFQFTEQYFLKRISSFGLIHPVIEYMCKRMDTALPLLIEKTGYSHKHLIQLFKKQVGLTPKYLQRIYRFNKVLNQIQSIPQKLDWATIVFDNHYYDQAHFIKEFNHFSGINPQSYLGTGSTCPKVIHTDTLR